MTPIDISGGQVDIPAGTFLLEDAIEIAADRSQVTITGQGPATILKRGAAMPAGKGLLNIRGTDIVLRNLTIEGDVTATTGRKYGTMTGENGGDDPMHADLTVNTSVWIHSGAKRVRLENVIIRHTGGYAVLIDARMADVEDVSIDSCRLEQCRPFLFGSSDGDLNYGSWVGGIHYQGDCREAAPYGVKGLSVVDCSFDRVNGACCWGHSYGFASHHENITVRNCRFSYVGFHCVGFGNVLGGTNVGNTGHHVGYVHYTDTDTPAPKVLGGAFSVCLDTAGWCENLVYTGNAFHEIAGEGSDLDGLSKGVVSGNSFIGVASSSYGLKGIQTGATFAAGAGCDIIIANNHLENFWYGAVVLAQGQRCTVRGNRIIHPSDASVAPIALVPIDCSLYGGSAPVCTENVVSGNDITYSGALFCIVEDQAAAFESADRNLVYGNTLHGSNAGEFRKHANSSSSSRLTDTFVAIGADRYTAGEANQFPATVALLTHNSGRMRISTSVNAGARVWENVVTDANPAAIPSSFVIPKSSTVDLGGAIVLKGGDKSGGGQWQDLTLDNQQGYLRLWGSTGPDYGANLLLSGTMDQASLTLAHGFVNSAQGFWSANGNCATLQLTSGGAAVKGLRIASNQSGGAYASGGYLAFDRDNFVTPTALSGESLANKCTLHYRYSTASGDIDDSLRFCFNGTLRMRLMAAGNLVLAGQSGAQTILVQAGYVDSAQGLQSLNGVADALYLRVTDGSAPKAGFRYYGSKLQWSHDLTTWADMSSGSALPSGTNAQTLRHNGTAWVASSLLLNDGTSVSIASAGNALFNMVRGAGAWNQITFLTGTTSDWLIGQGPGDSNWGIYSYGTSGWVATFTRTTGAVVFSGAASAAGLTLNAGYIRCDGGFYANGSNTDLIKAPSGGVTAKWFIGTTSLSLVGESAGNAGLSGSGQGRIYFDSAANKFKISENTGAYVNLLGAALPSGTSGQTIRHNGSAWVASSVIANDGTNVEMSGTLRIANHFYMPNNSGIHFRLFGTTTDKQAIIRGTDNHLYIDNWDVTNGDIYLRPANSRYVIIGNGSANAYLIPNLSGAINTIGTPDYPWDSINCAEYKYGGATLINSSGQFVGLGIVMPSYGCGASGFNCYSGGWKAGQTVTRYDRDGNVMTFYGGILAN